MIKRIVVMALTLLPQIIYADNHQEVALQTLDKNTLIEISKGLMQTLQTFECNYTYSTKILEGWDTAIGQSHHAFNKDGFNEVKSILYKRSNNAFYIKSENIFDKNKKDQITEKHTDGQLFWESRNGSSDIVINNQEPHFPLLYDNMLKVFPFDPYEYSSATPKENTLQQLINNVNNEVRFFSKQNGFVEVQIIEPSKHTFPGVKLLHKLVIELIPDVKIKSYSFGAIFLQGNREYLFHPQFEVLYSDYHSQAVGMPKLPKKIEITEFVGKDHTIVKNVEELIDRDKSSNDVPVKTSVITLVDFNKNPSFSTGEIAFDYPPGTHVFDQFAHRSYIIGDTLESLRKKIEPPEKP